jgi:hypothetical protein
MHASAIQRVILRENGYVLSASKCAKNGLFSEKHHTIFAAVWFHRKMAKNDPFFQKKNFG